MNCLPFLGHKKWEAVQTRVVGAFLDGRSMGLLESAQEFWRFRMEWYRPGGISQRLGWMTPDEPRAAMGYAV